MSLDGLMQKQLLGERLFPLVAQRKITGMLLEMDDDVLLDMLDSAEALNAEALNAKIMEAVSVLQMHAKDVDPPQMTPEKRVPINATVSSFANAPPTEMTASSLAAVPFKQQKQLLGERLLPLISAVEPLLARKITGMLLEMDNGELLNLLDSAEALNDKITEAVSVLEMGAWGVD